MAKETVVTVYSFRELHTGYESPSVSRFKTTLEKIRTEFGGDPIEGTAQLVSVEDLDADGRYCRVATGWSELS